jgi:hypothetical protein
LQATFAVCLTVSALSAMLFAPRRRSSSCFGARYADGPALRLLSIASVMLAPARSPWKSCAASGGLG